MATAGARFEAFLNHPAGPKTIHFWAPAMKWVRRRGVACEVGRGRCPDHDDLRASGAGGGRDQRHQPASGAAERTAVGRSVATALRSLHCRRR
jgi:hypothetical protein